MPAAMTAFRFRLEPTRAQKRELMRTAGSARWHLPKVGRIAFRMHRQMTGTPRTVSVTFDSGHWYVSIACQGEYTLPNSGGVAVGLDAGIAQSATLSTGEAVHFPVATPKEARRIKFFQRQAARRKKGSKRRSRSLQRVARLRRQIADRRTDAAHKLSYRLATTHAVIAVEDLKFRNMTRSAKGTVESPGSNVKAKSGLNRSLLAQGHADLVRMLTYKCERSGAKLVKVAPHFTSQTCSLCGHCAPENRENQAAFRCVACGYQQNADVNAALNILAAGQAVIARGGSEVTPAGEPRSDRRARRSSISGFTPTTTSSFS